MNRPMKSIYAVSTKIGGGLSKKSDSGRVVHNGGLELALSEVLQQLLAISETNVPNMTVANLFACSVRTRRCSTWSIRQRQV